MSNPLDLSGYFSRWDSFLRGLVNPDNDQPLVADVMKLVRRRSTQAAQSYALPLAIVRHADTTWEPESLLGTGATSKNGRLSWQIVLMFEALNDSDGLEGPFGAFTAAMLAHDAIQGNTTIAGTKLDIELGPYPFDADLIDADESETPPAVNAYGFDVSHEITYSKGW